MHWRQAICQPQWLRDVHAIAQDADGWPWSDFEAGYGVEAYGSRRQKRFPIREMTPPPSPKNRIGPIRPWGSASASGRFETIGVRLSGRGLELGGRPIPRKVHEGACPKPRRSC